MLRPFLTAAFVALLPLALGCSARRAPDAGAATNAEVAPVAADHHGSAAPTPRAQPRARTPDSDRTPGGESPTRVLFIGNSFTLQGPVPDLVAEFAKQSGFVNVTVGFRAVTGQSLAWHRADTSPAGAPARLREGWDVVVLQDFSTRPTEALGEPERFKEDVTWFYQRAKEANPAVRVVLYETWARREGHPVYGTAFSSPAQMQAQLRRNYDDAAERYVPRFASVAAGEPVEVARVGDAFELQLGRNEGLRLHAADDYHASTAGQYLSAAVLFSTIFDKSASDLPAINVSVRIAEELQQTADAVTGHGSKRPQRAPSSPLTDPSFNAA